MVKITRRDVTRIFGSAEDAAAALGIKLNSYYSGYPTDGPLKRRQVTQVIGAAVLEGRVLALPQEIQDMIKAAREVA